MDTNSDKKGNLFNLTVYSYVYIFLSVIPAALISAEIPNPALKALVIMVFTVFMFAAPAKYIGYSEENSFFAIAFKRFFSHLAGIFIPGLLFGSIVFLCVTAAFLIVRHTPLTYSVWMMFLIWVPMFTVVSWLLYMRFWPAISMTTLIDNETGYDLLDKDSFKYGPPFSVIIRLTKRSEMRKKGERSFFFFLLCIVTFIAAYEFPETSGIKTAILTFFYTVLLPLYTVETTRATAEVLEYYIYESDEVFVPRESDEKQLELINQMYNELYEDNDEEQPVERDSEETEEETTEAEELPIEEEENDPALMGFRAFGKGIDKINIKESEFEKPYLSAAYSLDPKYIEIFLNEGTDVNETDRNGESALSAALKNDNPVVAEHLIKKGTDVTIKDSSGNTALHKAAESHETAYLIPALIKRGADVNSANNKGATPLINAVKNYNSNAVNMLLGNGADPDKSDENGYTALHYAALCKSENIDDKDDYREIVMNIEALAQNNADMNKGDFDGKTPLILACINGYSDIVKLLLKNNADIRQKDLNGLSPVQHASENGHINLAKALIKAGSGVDLLTLTNIGDNEKVIQAIKKKPEMAKSTVPGSRETIFSRAVHSLSLEAVKVFMENGADPNKFSKCGSAIFCAANHRKDDEMVLYLISKGAYIDIDFKKTALMQAVTDNNVEMAELLIDLGANPNFVAQDGSTPAELAESEEMKKLFGKD